MGKIITIIMAILLVTGCGDFKPAAWALSGQDTDASFRLGARGGEVEIGGVIKYGQSDEIEWGPEPEVAGGYLLYHTTVEASITDHPAPSPLGPLLEALHARPYAGIELVGYCDGEKVTDFQPNYIAGSTFTVSQDGNIGIVVEYLDGDQARGDMYIGIMGRFK